MGVAPFSYAYTVPQYKKISNYLWWNRRAVEVSENLKISWLLLKWNGLQGIISSMAEIQEEKINNKKKDLFQSANDLRKYLIIYEGGFICPL